MTQTATRSSCGNQLARRQDSGLDFRAILMGLVFAFIWSSAFTSARIIVTNASPLAASAARFFIAGVIGVLIARAIGNTWNLTRTQWQATFIFGLCQNAIYLGLNFVAMQTIEASLASIIASTMPLIVAFFGWSVLRDKLPGMAIFGLVLGFAGVAIIMSSRVQAGVDLQGVILCVIGATALAIATLSMRTASSGGNLMIIVGLQMFVGAAILGVASLLLEDWHLNPTPAFMWAFVYTLIFPGIIATWIWFSLVERIGATRAATCLLYTSPSPRDS